jgi:hypothetical protein
MEISGRAFKSVHPFARGLILCLLGFLAAVDTSRSDPASDSQAIIDSLCGRFSAIADSFRNDLAPTCSLMASEAEVLEDYLRAMSTGDTSIASSEELARCLGASWKEMLERCRYRTCDETSPSCVHWFTRRMERPLMDALVRVPPTTIGYVKCLFLLGDILTALPEGRRYETALVRRVLRWLFKDLRYTLEEETWLQTASFLEIYLCTAEFSSLPIPRFEDFAILEAWRWTRSVEVEPRNGWYVSASNSATALERRRIVMLDLGRLLQTLIAFQWQREGAPPISIVTADGCLAPELVRYLPRLGSMEGLREGLWPCGIPHERLWDRDSQDFLAYYLSHGGSEPLETRFCMNDLISGEPGYAVHEEHTVGDWFWAGFEGPVAVRFRLEGRALPVAEEFATFVPDTRLPDYAPPSAWDVEASEQVLQSLQTARWGAEDEELLKLWEAWRPGLEFLIREGEPEEELRRTSLWLWRHLLRYEPLWEYLRGKRGREPGEATTEFFHRLDRTIDELWLRGPSAYARAWSAALCLLPRPWGFPLERIRRVIRSRETLASRWPDKDWDRLVRELFLDSPFVMREPELRGMVAGELGESPGSLMEPTLVGPRKRGDILAAHLKWLLCVRAEREGAFPEALADPDGTLADAHYRWFPPTSDRIWRRPGRARAVREALIRRELLRVRSEDELRCMMEREPGYRIVSYEVRPGRKGEPSEALFRLKGQGVPYEREVVVTCPLAFSRTPVRPDRQPPADDD